MKHLLETPTMAKGSGSVADHGLPPNTRLLPGLPARRRADT